MIIQQKLVVPSGSVNRCIHSLFGLAIFLSLCSVLLTLSLTNHMAAVPREMMVNEFIIDSGGVGVVQERVPNSNKEAWLPLVKGAPEQMKVSLKTWIGMDPGFQDSGTKQESMIQLKGVSEQGKDVAQLKTWIGEQQNVQDSGSLTNQGEEDEARKPLEELSPVVSDDPSGKRRGLIILGFSRSGTSFLSHLFNQDQDVFNIYEPLQMSDKWPKKDNVQHRETVREVLSAAMSCDYESNNNSRRFLEDLAKNKRFRLQSNALSSPPLCAKAADFESCSPLEPRRVSDVCRTQYKHSVVKVCYERIPTTPGILPFTVSVLIDLKKRYPDSEVRILHLVRDPRGLINSRINMFWMTDFLDASFPSDAERLCATLQQNIVYGRGLEGWLKTHYKELTYEEFYSNPVEKTQELYDFAGFGAVPDRVREWVQNNTDPADELWKKERYKLLSLTKRSQERVEMWKEEAAKERTQIIEQRCKNVMELMGLEFVTSS